MTPYPGSAPLTVNVSGTGSNGVIVTSGPTDAHGFYPVGLSIDDGDQRNAGNMSSLGQADANRANWLAWRAIDWIGGGTYTWTTPVALSTQLTLNNRLNVVGQGGTGAIVATGGTTGFAIDATGGTTSGTAIIARSGGGNAIALKATGMGTGPAAQFTPGATADTPAVLLDGGGLSIPAYAPAVNDVLPANVFGAAHFVKFWAALSTIGGGVGVVDGINIATGGVSVSGMDIIVNFATPMISSSTFMTAGTFRAAPSNANVVTAAYPVVVTGLASSQIKLSAWNGNSQIDLSSTPGFLDVMCIGRQ